MDLATAYLADYSRVAAFYAKPPHLRDLAQRLGDPCPRPLGSEDLAEITDFNTLPFSDVNAVRGAVRRLADPRCCAVVTGQQAGLLLGPLYTVFKAINAIQIARRLEEATGRPAVALFWIAADDHDFEEVRRVSWLGADGERHHFALPLPAGWEGHSVGKVPVDSEALRSLVERWRDDGLGNPEVLQVLEEAVGASATLGDLFRRLLLRLLQTEGLIAVHPWLSAIRNQLPHVLRPEIEQPGSTTALVLDVSERLSAAGFEAQVHRRPGDVNFFIYVDGVRAKVSWDGQQFVLAHPHTGAVLAKRSRDQMLADLEGAPGLFSPNVLTKPLVRELVFRTAAYVAGPGEIAYHAQIKPLYESRDIAMPAIVPRSRAALLTPKVRRALERLGQSAARWLSMSDEERARTAALRSSGAAALEAFEEQRRRLAEQIDALETAVADFDPGLRRGVQRLRGSVDGALDKLGGQMIQRAQQRDAALAAAQALVRNALLPDGHPQERVDNLFFPHLVHEGLGLIPCLLSELEPARPDVQFIETH